jgi:hypothetical protein
MSAMQVQNDSGRDNETMNQSDPSDVKRKMTRWLPRSWPTFAAMGVLPLLFGAMFVVGPKNALQRLVFSLLEDTGYAEGYSEHAFQSIQVGDTEASVRTALGAPIREVAVEPHTCWLYARDPQPEFVVTGAARADSSYTVIQFGENGTFRQTIGQISTGPGSGSISFGPGINTLSVTPARAKKWLAEEATKQQIEGTLGKPRETFESRTSKWLLYSHSPSSTHYRLRRIGIGRDGKVSKKQSRMYWD